MSGLKTPVLFLVFNRPAETARVFEAIRGQRPQRLYVAADGARPDRPDDPRLVHETRTIASQVDWPCEVKTLFRDTNLGCGRAVSGAISWFFEHVEEGIILEDDCLPHPDFFPYCETLLERYRHESRIATIAGTHFLPAALPHEHSHYVSKYFQMWGWATWRRTWEQYDFALNKLDPAGWSALLQAIHPIAVESKYWMQILNALQTGAIDTWDFQVFFSSWRIGGNHVMPGRNLISNIGYGPEATHTNFASSMAEIPTHALTVGPDPVPLAPDPIVDNLIFYLRFLESLTHTYWLEQVISPDDQLGATRHELQKQNRRVRQLEFELAEKRRQLLAATKALAQAEAARMVRQPSALPSMSNDHWPHPGNIADFSYSKLSHFECFRALPFQSYNVGDPDPALCDLKVYQDYLVYCFIRRNVPPGARILEVGGGDSRILKHFSAEYECWNADKCEGLGNGPIKFTSPHYRIVYDYVGSFNPELPDAHFDFVFSISALEHTPEDQTIRVNVLKDMNRVLKPGCLSFHCFDAILRSDGKSWVNGLVPYLYANAPLQTKFVPLAEIDENPDTYAMSRQAYEANWQPITKDSYETFGRAFSLNLLWRRPS